MPTRLKEKISSDDSLLASGKKFSVRIAKTNEELDEIFRVRYQVFQHEFHHASVPPGASEIDFDEYDEQFHHLRLIDNSSQKTIGTYRIQTSEDAENGRGFYSANEFKIDQFGDEIINNAVEVGRACILPDYRNSGSLLTLWKGLAKFLVLSGKRYLFGCSSVNGTDPQVARKVIDFLARKNFFHQEINVAVQPNCIMEIPLSAIDNTPVDLPKLFMIYLKHTGKVCGGPALDEEMETMDFLTLVDVENFSPISKKIFFEP